MNLTLRKIFTQTESNSFQPIKKEVERARIISGSVPRTTKNPEDFKIPIDYDLSFRLAIQEFKYTKEPAIKETDNILPLKKLINPELEQKYQTLIETIEKKSTVSDEHPEREFLDVEDERISKQIESLTCNIIKNIEIERGSKKLNQDEIYELEALSWFYFDSLINASNTKSLALDISEFYQASNYDKSGIEEQEAIKNELIKKLEIKYPFKKDELEILIDLMTPEKNKSNLFKTLSRIYDQYDLKEKKGPIAKIVLSFLFAHVIQGITPFFFQYGIAFPTVGHLAGNGISAYLDLLGELNEAKLMNEVKPKVNKRISQSMVFNKYRFTQDRSLGEIIETLDRGKEATIKLLSESMSLILPQSVGIGTAFTCLTLINPILGFINLLTVPLTFLIGNIYNRKINPIHQSEIKADEEVTSQIASLKYGIEGILTSPHTQKIERAMKDKMDAKDELTFKRIVNEIKMRYAAYFTFTTTVGISSGVALALHLMGKISEGAVLSNVFYSEAMGDPFKELVKKYFTQFKRYEQDINRMEEVLGDSNKLDLPDGEKEKDRIPVSKLNNCNIFIRGLEFKNILKGIDLDINEGEFVTIVGPSGIGKSTLLRNIAGLDQPDRGSIQIGGDNGFNGVNTINVKKYGESSIYSIMSYSNQDPYIFPDMTIRENIEFYNEPIDDKEFITMLTSLNLQKFIDRLDEKFDHFSGGEKVRIGLARALFTKPKILLLDEPTRGLDSGSALEVRNILKTIHASGTTIICVTHDETLIEESLSLGKSIKLRL